MNALLASSPKKATSVISEADKKAKREQYQDKLIEAYPEADIEFETNSVMLGVVDDYVAGYACDGNGKVFVDMNATSAKRLAKLSKDELFDFVKAVAESDKKNATEMLKVKRYVSAQMKSQIKAENFKAQAEAEAEADLKDLKGVG